MTEVGVDVKEGDYVLAIDGEELAGSDNPYRLLRNKADRPVQMTVNSRPEHGWRPDDHIPADLLGDRSALSRLRHAQP